MPSAAAAAAVESTACCCPGEGILPAYRQCTFLQASGRKAPGAQVQQNRISGGLKYPESGQRAQKAHFTEPLLSHISTIWPRKATTIQNISTGGTTVVT